MISANNWEGGQVIVRRLALVVCVLALVLAVVASSCAAPQASPEKEIPVGNRFTLTGPIASTAVPACYGFADYMNLVNERGGIDGVKINVLWRDTFDQPLYLREASQNHIECRGLRHHNREHTVCDIDKRQADAFESRDDRTAH